MYEGMYPPPVHSVCPPLHKFSVTGLPISTNVASIQSFCEEKLIILPCFGNVNVDLKQSLSQQIFISIHYSFNNCCEY